NIHRKLVRIPSVLIISPVSVDTAQHPRIRSYSQLVLEGMQGQSGMIYFYIDLEILRQSVMADESGHRRRVIIILMLGGFCRLGHYEEGTGESVLPRIVPCQMQKTSQMLLLPLHVRVQQRHITFPAAPEHIILS